MKLNTQPYKGARDFFPEDKQTQEWVFNTWRRVVEKYGYQSYDSPILEPTDLYLMKGNDEIIKEQTYTFKDRGDRSVTIRTEMTPSVSRMVAGRRQELAYPVRWYSIPNLWRYERMQRGRLREFWQLNVDMFGVKSNDAEIEMIQIIDNIFSAFKAKRSQYVVKISSRVLINTMFTYTCGMSSDQSNKLIKLTDKKNKMSAVEFNGAVNEIAQNMSTTNKIVKLLNIKKLSDLPKELRESPSVKELEKILNTCKSLGISNLEFDISLMRGFDYYTDIVFEAFDTNPENSRSLLGGGRYDGLVAQFGCDPVPTIGFAAGDVGFTNFLETHKLLPAYSQTADITLILDGDNSASHARSVAEELRSLGLKVSVDYSKRKLDKQFKAAKKSQVAYLITIEGENIKDSYTLKVMSNNDEEKHNLSRIAKIVLDSRKLQ